ncbi:hypothetical protein HYX01_01660 [Candidatus Woesearchaeota archaeon]|nr:hypothetical protein [Candidatus Woesearchaeota archaeon]
MPLDDKTIEEFYKLGQELREIPEKEHVKSLKGILHEHISKYFHEKKDKKTHEIKWESDEQIKSLTDSLWDKAAEHIAEYYLKMDQDTIKKLRGAKEPDNPNQSQFDTFMTVYLGSTKEDFFNTLKNNPTMNPENLLEYIKPLYETHIKIMSGQKIRYKVNTNEQAQHLLEYLKLIKEHNPKYVKLRVPKTFKSIDEVTGLYMQALNMLPETYHPKKPDTYSKKPDTYSKKPEQKAA